MDWFSAVILSISMFRDGMVFGNDIHTRLLYLLLLLCCVCAVFVPCCWSCDFIYLACFGVYITIGSVVFWLWDWWPAFCLPTEYDMV